MPFSFCPSSWNCHAREAGPQYGQSRNGGDEQVVVSGVRQAAPLGPLRDQVERYTRDKSRDREMDQQPRAARAWQAARTGSRRDLTWA